MQTGQRKYRCQTQEGTSSYMWEVGQHGNLVRSKEKLEGK